MRKMFLSTLVVFGFMNFGTAQLNTSIERISVKAYDTDGILEQFQLKGNEALAFDVPAYILENDHLERLVIDGSIRTALLSTTIKFDSNSDLNQEGDHICKDVDSKMTPFLGVWGTTRRGSIGVDIREVIATTSADKAGITASDNIISFDGQDIATFPDLKKAVAASTIGDKVQLEFENESKVYSKDVIVGSRGIEKITYKYCTEEPVVVLPNNSLSVDRDEVSLTSYPNPTNSLSHIDFNSVSNDDVIFTVMDITGNLVHKQTFTNFDGSLSFDYNHNNNSVGTYIIAIQQGKEMYKRNVQLVK